MGWELYLKSYAVRVEFIMLLFYLGIEPKNSCIGAYAYKNNGWDLEFILIHAHST